MINKTGYIKSTIPIVGIYKITSPSGRVYIGQSWNIRKRWNEHKWPKSKSRGIIKLENSIKKYGFAAHTFEIIHQLPADVDQSVLDTYEILYTYQYKSIGVPMLNIKIGGRGGKHSEETKAKLKISNSGRKHSDECKRKISLANTGRMLSDEAKQKISIANSGKSPSLEVRAKMSASSRRTPMTPDHKKVLVSYTQDPVRNKKISDSWANKSEADRNVMLANLRHGQPHSDATKKKISDIRKGTKMSGESSKKKSEAMKSIWASMTPEKREHRLQKILINNKLRKNGTVNYKS